MMKLVPWPIKISAIFATFTQTGFRLIYDMCDMKRYLWVIKRNDIVFAHIIGIPAELVRELGLDDNTVELKIKDTLSW